MPESAHSDEFLTRFSTPVDELDDHRNQLESLPRADGTMPHSRRGTAEAQDQSAMNAPALTLQVPELDHGVRSRDFEVAVDDDGSDAGSVRGNRRLSGRRGSISPVVARRSHFRRPRQRDDEHNHSRDSSRSSSSSRNSVDAFAAPPLRPRAGTAGTLASVSPSIHPNAHHHRIPSVESFHRARTMSQDQPNQGEGGSDHGSVEDDVCYVPPEEPQGPYTIDFEDLEEFVEKERHQDPAGRRSRQASYSCQGGPPKIFHDKRTQSGNCEKLESESPALDSGESVVDEKLSALDQPKIKQRMNRFSFFSTELEQSIHAPNLGDLLMPGESFKHLFELGPEGGCWWLDMAMPTEEEVEVICKAFDVHGLTREDIIQHEPREKVELFKSYYFVCFRSFFQVDHEDERYLDPVNVYAIVFREGILTFTFAPSPHAANVRKRMGRLRDYVSLGADWICYALIDDIVDSFGPIIRSLEIETDIIEDSVFTARPEDSINVLKQISECRKRNTQLVRLLGGKADVIKGFAKRCNESYSVAPRQEVGLYLSDIQDHVVTMMSNLGHFEKMLSRSHSNYLAQISLDSIAQGTRANEVLGKVTFIGTLLVPMNLVCGLFGMNVTVPGQDSGELGWFFGILGCLIGFVSIATIVAKRMRYI